MPVNPFDPTTFTEGGLSGVKKCEGDVESTYYGEGSAYNYPGDVFVVELGNAVALDHDDPGSVGPIDGGYRILYGISTTKGSSWEYVNRSYAKAGIPITADGRNFGSGSTMTEPGRYTIHGGKHLVLEQQVANVYVERASGETKETKRLVPVQVGAAGAPPKSPPKTAVATEDFSDRIGEELAATLVGLATGKTSKEFAQAVIMNAEVRKAKLGAAARSGALLGWMVEQGLVELKDGKIVG